MIPIIDIANIADKFNSLADQLLAVIDDDVQTQNAATPAPDLLVDAMLRLFEVFRRLEHERLFPPADLINKAFSDRDIHALGDYGLKLLGQLSAWAERLHMPAEAHQLEGLSFPLACWIARQGGELSNLTSVVNSAAALANTLKETADLERLYGLLGEIVDAVSPQISQDLDKANPIRPWRILLLNRAIVATRSHQPLLMNQAFEFLADNLPEEAPQFFREGMEQMDALNYPSPVRAVMQRYYNTWCTQRTLH